MNKKHIGSFYFKKTTNGNLVGEFTNNKTKYVLTESADLVKETDTFAGSYTSSWHEGQTVHKADLGIIGPTKQGKYSLLWRMKGKDEFWGEGMVCEDTLIGHYTNFNPMEL